MGVLLAHWRFSCRERSRWGTDQRRLRTEPASPLSRTQVSSPATPTTPLTSIARSSRRAPYAASTSPATRTGSDAECRLHQTRRSCRRTDGGQPGHRRASTSPPIRPLCAGGVTMTLWLYGRRWSSWRRAAAMSVRKAPPSPTPSAFVTMSSILGVGGDHELTRDHPEPFGDQVRIPLGPVLKRALEPKLGQRRPLRPVRFDSPRRHRTPQSCVSGLQYRDRVSTWRGQPAPRVTETPRCGQPVPARCFTP